MFVQFQTQPLLINLLCLCSVGASVETAVSFCYKTSVNVIAVANSRAACPKVRYAAPRIQSSLSPEMESEVGRREIQDERQTTVPTERKWGKVS